MPLHLIAKPGLLQKPDETDQSAERCNGPESLNRFEFGMAPKRVYKLRHRSVPFWSDGSLVEHIELQLLGTERPFFNSGFRV